MNARRLSASGASLALHVLAAAAIVWLPVSVSRTSASPQSGSGTAIASYPWEHRVPKPDQAGQVEKNEDKLDVGIDDGGDIDVQLPGFTFDVRKIARRSSSLFPFLTGREIARLAEKHHPDSGRLPALLRGYLDQNLLQPYEDSSIRDPRLWTMLGIAADNSDFLDFIGAYEARHPSTKSSTELLFLLDELTQGNFDGLAALLAVDPPRDLAWTRETSPKAYDLAVTLRQRYAAEVERRGFTSPAKLRAHFDEVRLEILTNILRTTPDGYRSNDARYLMGSVHWKQERREEAARLWREITIDRTDSYVAAYEEIVGVVRAPADPIPPLTAVRIDGILAAENRRWADFSVKRLRQFGYAFDTY